MPVDADTKSFLEDVKKGKPRRFVMICKGAEIQSLIVYKKGAVEKYKKQAKETGKGQFYHGVVDGKGADICFKLLRGDGYEKPPGKDIVLKEFLSSEADMKFKPTYSIVDALPDIDEGDESRTTAPAPSTATAAQQAPSAPQAPESTADYAGEFTRRLTALVPDLKQALAANSPGADQLKAMAAKAQALGKEKKYGEAMPVLQELEQMVAAVLAKNGTPSTAPPQTSAPTVDDGKGFSIVNAQSSRLAWDATRKKVQSQLQELEKAILSAVETHNQDKTAEDEYEMTEVAEGTKQLYLILDELDTRLIDKLDEALNADGEARVALHKEAKEIINEYQQFVASDPLMAAIDNNGFFDSSIRKVVDGTLSVLASKI